VTCHIHRRNTPHHQAIANIFASVRPSDHATAPAVGKRLIEELARDGYGYTGFHLRHCNAR
jgi:hypothetical protein